MTARHARAPLQATDLRIGATYIAPSGRLCRLAQSPRSGPGSDGLSFAFDYVVQWGPHEGKPRDGFRMSSANVRLLRPAHGR